MKRGRRCFFAIAGLAVVVLTVMVTGQHNTLNAGTGCNASTIAGAYGFALDGLVSGSFSGQPQRIGEFVPLAAAGTFAFDGHGNASRAFTVSFGGVITPSRDSGPYTVDSNCTASATFSDGTWSMVIIGGGSEIKAINSTPGVLVQGVLTRMITRQ